LSFVKNPVICVHNSNEHPSLQTYPSTAPNRRNGSQNRIGPGSNSSDQHRNWIGGWSSNSQVNPAGLMLWKKVQHYVVVGGAFVNAAAANTGEASNEDQPVKPQLQQNQFSAPKRN
jgi:hypothetical protein